MKKTVIGMGWLICCVGIYHLTIPVNGEASMIINSSAFKHGGQLPTDFSCDGANENPPLKWTQGPDGTKSYVLIVDDPDAPTAKPWVHWLVINIPASITSLSQKVNFDDNSVMKIGKNSEGAYTFQGACPPKGHGVHRYYFRIYALDIMLDMPRDFSREDVEKAMKGHILSEAYTLGTYERK